MNVFVYRSYTFDVNEKLATQAFAEASQLHLQKNELLDQFSFMQESLGKADAEIALIRKHSDEKVQELLMQLNTSKAEQLGLPRMILVQSYISVQPLV